MSNTSENKIIEFLLENIFIPEYRYACYLCDELQDLIQIESRRGHLLLLTGSLSEGVQNGNDKDVMTVIQRFIVVESIEQVPADYSDYVLIIDQTECKPCFTRLKLLRKPPEHALSESHYFTEYNGELYLNRLKLMNKATKHYKTYMYHENNEDAPLHGPALLVEEVGDTDMDFVPCLKMPSWPSFGKDALSRIMHSCSVETRNKIESEGCHLVGVPHPQSAKPEIEFRISFSIAEKSMIRTWTTKQIKVYYLCKELFNAYFKDKTSLKLEKGLCSYFAKTTILWMIENRDKEYWKDNYFLDILDEIFEILSSNLSNRSCPNYFLPRCYLMETYTESQIRQLQEQIKLVRKELLLRVLACKSFKFYLQEKWEEVYSKCKRACKGDDPGITDALADSICCDRLFRNSEGIAIKDLNHWQRMRTLIGQFMVFCQTDYWTYYWYRDDPVKVLSKISTILHSKFQVKYGVVFCSYFHCAIMRSIAHNLMDDTFRLFAHKRIDQDQFLSNFTKVKSYILGAYRWNGILSDHNISGLVYLGLVHDRFGYKKEAKEFFNRAIGQFYTYIKEYRGRIPPMRMSIVITGKYGKAPAFLLLDRNLTALFEERHMHQIEFDPIVLALYLLVTLEEKWARKHFQILDQKFLYLRSSEAQSSSLIDSYQFLKYRLGLMSVNERIDYEQFLSKIDNNICSECSEIELFNANFYKPNSAVSM